MEATKNKKFKLAIDGHVLLQKEKTGVGLTAQYLIDELVRNSGFEIQINFADFFGYRCREIIKHYWNEGCKVKLCWWLPYSVYNKLFETFKLPYFLIFGRKNDITLFFEYQVPYRVGTKTANYVYDVNYKVYPETVDKSALRWLNEKIPIYCDRSDIIITISEFSKKEIEKYMGIEGSRVQVVPCGVDCKKYNGSISESQVDAVKGKYRIEGSYILYMGTLEPRKNIALLIEAYYALAKEKDNLPKLVIAGKKGWMYEQLFDMVVEYGLDDRVVFTGYIEDSDSPALMSGAELFVFPSIYEGFGIPPLEAMACGTPVIISDAGALLEVAGGGAVVFRSGDAADLKVRISQLMENEETRKKVSIEGRKWTEKYTWEMAGKELGRILCNGIEF